MTPKQRAYVNFIEDMTGVEFHEGDNLDAYIKANKDKAHEKWKFECELEALHWSAEDAGDRY